ncbi:MAG: carbamate kinase [Clostridia bacterium]|nr:carbamate kinase [Clostridia bacterium]
MGVTLVIAIGGNAILKEGQKGTAEEQFANVMACCGPIVDLYAQGHRIVLVHGNGPQVGNILLQVEAAADTVAPQTIDLCGAQTQGQLGYMLQRAVHNVMNAKGVPGKITSVVTQVVVDPEDPAFLDPTKPIGPFYSAQRAEELRREQPGMVLKEDAGRGYRRVVPSPKPLRIIEKGSVNALLAQNHIVVTGGGGGIPVAEKNNAYMGVEAVVDKDLVAAIVARDVEADRLVILTGVDEVYVDFGKPTQRPIRRMTASEARAYMVQGQFPAGSMKPKIEAALGYLQGGGREVVITSIEHLSDALRGQSGTIIWS